MSSEWASADSLVLCGRGKWHTETRSLATQRDSRRALAGAPCLSLRSPSAKNFSVSPGKPMGMERGLEGRDELLKLVERQAGEIQELHRAGL